MGRRRQIGAVRGAGGRRIVCLHPARSQEFQVQVDGPPRRRCRRCGADLLPLLDPLPLPKAGA
jgi:hypothetical protein